MEGIVYSLIIPVYRNEESISDLVTVIKEFSSNYSKKFETVFVIDGSPDNSYLKLKECLKNKLFNYQIINHSRNFGSFAAIRTGMAHAKGEYLSVMAADLQEPISLSKDFFSKLERNECDIAFGKRIERDDPFFSMLFSNIFWFIYKKLIQKDIPTGGVDVFACSRQVSQTILKFNESNSSLLGILFWVGYRRSFVEYKRAKREKGSSAWSFSRKITYLLDSCFSFSNLPVQLLMYVGFFGVFLSLFLSISIILAKFFGDINVPGYTATAMIILFFAGLNSFGLGLIGNYIWRAYENTKNRPLTIIQSIEKSEE